MKGNPLISNTCPLTAKAVASPKNLMDLCPFRIGSYANAMVNIKPVGAVGIDTPSTLSVISMLDRTEITSLPGALDPASFSVVGKMVTVVRLVAASNVALLR